MTRLTPAILAKRRAQYQRQLDDSVRQVVDKLSPLPTVRRILVGGSYGRGETDLRSDLDVVVVMETDRPYLERLRALYPLLAVPVDMDLLCYTPDEFEALKDRPFLKTLLQDAKVVYEAQAA